MRTNAIGVTVLFGIAWSATVDDNVLLSQCAEGCLNCTLFDGSCITCKPGKWGRYCQQDCRLSTCLNNACEIDTGECTYGCADGLFSAEDSCLTCPPNCVRCKHETHCTECVDGWYGLTCNKRCQRGCKRCQQTYSGKDTSTCLRCARGKYGSGFHSCLYDCSLCRSGACTIDGCRHGCIPGYHNYKSIACVKCFLECETCNFRSWNEKKCLTCPSGRWGDLCAKTCPVTCGSDGCDQSTGVCTTCSQGDPNSPILKCGDCSENCNSCNDNGECTQCRNGRFGPTCELQCAEDCHSCSGTSRNCTSCPDGRYLRNTECHPCPVGCTKCDWIDENVGVSCSECDDGFFKDIPANVSVPGCYKCPEGCSVCDWHGDCLQCKPSHHSFLSRCCPSECAECITPNRCTVCAEGYKCDMWSKAGVPYNGSIFGAFNETNEVGHQPTGLAAEMILNVAILYGLVISGTLLKRWII